MGQKFTNKGKSEYKFFSSHSCRSSVSSKAYNIGIDLENILNMWMEPTINVSKFYSKELEYMGKDKRVPEAFMNSFNIRVCDYIYDTVVNIHYQKYFQSAFQFQISITH